MPAKPKPFDFSWETYVRSRVRETKQVLGCNVRTPEEWRTWRDALHCKLLELLGPFPLRRCPLRMQVLEEKRVRPKGQAQPYLQRKVVYFTEPDVPVPAYLLTPLGRKADLPALLCLHGHGNGKDDVMGFDRGDPKRRELICALNYDYARQFAERGYVVLAPDARGWGERAHADVPGRDRCNIAFLKGMLVGLNPLNRNIWDLMRAIDLLQSLPQVNPERIGGVGLSQGATHTLFVSALDERVRVAVVSGYLSTYQRLVLDWLGVCGSQFLPSILRYANIGDIACLIAPRPVLFENGTKERVIPFDGAKKEYRRVKRLYEVLGIPERVEMDVFEGDHQFSGRLAFDWVKRWLT
jgi:dienelactone hydrolase